MKHLINRFEAPIPCRQDDIKGWQGIKIEDSGEELVSLTELAAEYPIVARSQYYLRGLSGSIPDCLVREGVARRLVQACRLLPNGLRLVIWDGWRPRSVQKALFDEYLEVLRAKYPELQEHVLAEKATEFVSLPSTNPLAPAPHSTGGAVDLSIMKENGEYLETGTDFDDFTTKAHTSYYENQFATNSESLGDVLYLRNRRLLYSIMSEAGFTNYPAEWWHYDYGNQWWALLSGEGTAKYGYIAPADLAGQP